jgi:hypothetical protein
MFLYLTETTFVFRIGSYMYRIISSRVPCLVSRIRAPHPILSGTSKVLRRVDAPAPARLCPEVHRQFFGLAKFFSSRQLMEPFVKGNQLAQLAQPALFCHMTRTLTRMQALIPTAIRVADGSVAMLWSENHVLYISTSLLYVVGF